MTRIRHLAVLAGCMAILSTPEMRADDPAAAAPRPDDEITARSVRSWADMRFGMFIHWGPVALEGTEIGWSRGRQVPTAKYDQLYEKFNPTRFDADEWARIAKDAGMKYLVITSKHHDGFCLWPSKLTDYHIGNTPFKRDVLAELSAACKKHGVLFSTYYSICDWYHPDYPTGSPGGRSQKSTSNMPRYFEYVKGQTRELIERYGPLGIMWFDGEWEKPWTRGHGNELYSYLKKLQPTLVVNNRVSKGRHGMAGTTKQSDLNAGDYDTPEQRIGGFNRGRPWETCMTICRQWAWKPNDSMKSLEQCLQTLIFTVGGDGNLLFNVGPMADGRIEPRQVDRLREMGKWLKRYGDGIYGTRGGPFKPGKWGASTCRDKRIWLYVMRWPQEGALELPAIGRKIVNARALSGGDVRAEQSADGITIELPTKDRTEIATVIELTVDGDAFAIEPAAVRHRSDSLAFDRKATASNVYREQIATYGPKKAIDDDPQTRWATDVGTSEAWLEVDLGAPMAIGRIAIDEPTEYARVRSFELQHFVGGAWKTFLAGTTIGPRWSKKITPITAQRVRLNILSATDGPTLTEFQLFAPKR